MADNHCQWDAGRKCLLCGFVATPHGKPPLRVCPQAAPITVRPADPDLPCLHRGDVLRGVKCQLCGGREKIVEVHACALHGECALHRTQSGAKGEVRQCLTCRDRIERPPVTHLAAVTSYYNPAGYRTRRENFDRFAAGVEAAGVPLFVAEAGLAGRFELPASDRIWRFPARASLWQKERLLNLAIERLPPHFDAVAWLDADLLFENPDWPRQTLARLGEFAVVQPWETVGYLDQAGELHQWRADIQYNHALAKIAVGHPGYAWAARRDALAAMGGLWDASICGSGDLLMARAFRGEIDRVAPYARAWATRAAQVTAGRLGFVPGRILHLWHGAHADRHYQERIRTLEHFGFDPALHLRHDGGLWAWSDAAPASLQHYVAQYFHTRKEDGPCSPK